ncbi:MAG: toxin-antitoxin system HicB family antitoxin [Nitrosomonas sp.]|nr:toxin-antitoxin system HicB family antitoxin [Nitrosomonas sp.]MDP1950890.1 toxin-antitoxin system HicB family antitoxin [Nitrosomonas sp.]
MSINPYAYNITIRRDTFEGEVLFEARVKELPDLTEYGESYEEAYNLAVDTIETTAEIFAEKGRRFPDAMVPIDEFSGRVTLRLPRSLHRVLAENSDTEGVSLNQHLVNVLSYCSGFAAGNQTKGLPAWRSVSSAQDTSKTKANQHLRLVRNDNLKTANSDWG